MKYLTDEQLREKVRKMCQGATQRVVAAQLGVSECHLSEYLAANRTAGHRIPEAMGFSEKIMYQPLDGDHAPE